jgi:hypothetical protein
VLHIWVHGCNLGCDAMETCKQAEMFLWNVGTPPPRQHRITTQMTTNGHFHCHEILWSHKDKVVPLCFTEALLGERRYSSYFLNLSTRRGWVVSITPWPRFTPGERAPGTHCTGSWVGPRASLDAKVGGKFLCLCRGSNPSRPAIVSHYTDWATLALSFDLI